MRRGKITGPALKHMATCPAFAEDPRTDEDHPEEFVEVRRACNTGDLDGLNGEQLALAQKCLNAIAPLARKAERDVRRMEVTVPIINSRESVDRVIRLGRILYAINWHLGLQPPDDGDAYGQSLVCALGLFHEMPDIDRVVVLIVSPRSDEISKHAFTRADTPGMKARLVGIVTRQAVALDQDREDLLRPTGDSCSRCDHRNDCPALYKIASTVAQGYSAVPLGIPLNLHSSTWTTPEEHAAGRLLALVMEQWAESVKRHGLQFALTTGQAIPGFELKSRAGKREIRDAAAAYAALKDDAPLEDFLAACGPVSLSKLEESMASRAPRGAKSQSKEALHEKLSAFGIAVPRSDVKYLARVRD